MNEEVEQYNKDLEARRLLEQNFNYIFPKADRTLAKANSLIGIPWKFFEWRRLMKEHDKLLAQANANCDKADALMRGED